MTRQSDYSNVASASVVLELELRAQVFEPIAYHSNLYAQLMLLVGQDYESFEVSDLGVPNDPGVGYLTRVTQSQLGEVQAAGSSG